MSLRNQLTERQLDSAGGTTALEEARLAMLAHLQRFVRDERVIEAMARVDRTQFLPNGLHGRAYDNCALPIGAGQTISQPLMAALMLQAASIRPDEHVLEVGTGSGYQAAVLSLLAKSVITVERIEQLRARSAERLRSAGYKEVEVHRAEEVVGWPAGAPYNAIIVAAGAPHVPRSLLRQLAQGGRLVIPVGDERAQELVVVCNEARGMTLVRLGACAFVLLIGHEAWETGTVRGFD